MKTIPISEIIVAPQRHRQAFPPARLNELSESIRQEGLFHAIVLRRDGDSLVLVAGERRLRACSDIHSLGGEFTYDSQQVPAGEVPYVLLGELDPLAREVAELNENLRRDDLTWQERASALARVAELRAMAADAAGLPAPTNAQIAEEFNPPVRAGFEGTSTAQAEEVRQQIAVARHLDDPEVKAAKTHGEAYKLLRRREERQKNVKLAERVGRSLTGESHSCVQADSKDWLLQQPDGKFSVIVTDPPYGVNAHLFGDSNGRGKNEHDYDDSPENFRDILKSIPEELFRVSKPDAHLYWFCDFSWFFELAETLRNVGWDVHKTPLIWYNASGLRAPWVDFGPQRKYELILYALKSRKENSRKVTKMVGDVISIPRGNTDGHAAQKPTELYKDLLARSARPGDEVLDPFCGSGPIFPAAHELKLRATGVEKDPASYGISLKRIQELK